LSKNVRKLQAAGGGIFLTHTVANSSGSRNSWHCYCQQI